MKKSEQIKQLEAQLQEYKWKCEEMNHELNFLNSTREACPCPEPYFTKISKHDAYQLALQYYKIQPDQHTTLGSFLSKVDEIIEWHNNQEPNITELT